MNKLIEKLTELKLDNCISASIVIGARLKRFRKSLGLTGSELGKIINCSQQQISRVENGVSKLNIEQLFDISKKTRISIFYLLQGIGYQDRSCTYTFTCSSEQQANTIIYFQN